MKTTPDCEDLLDLFEKHEVRYLIVGGVAVSYYARPRYTKDMDILVDPAAENVQRANAALAEFGSTWLLSPGKADEIVQIGVEPNRVDLLAWIEKVDFDAAWRKRVRDLYGRVMTNWIDLDSLIRAKEGLRAARHREDVRALKKAKERRDAEEKKDQCR